MVRRTPRSRRPVRRRRSRAAQSDGDAPVVVVVPGGSPSLDFSDADNSMYVPLISYAFH